MTRLKRNLLIVVALVLLVGIGIWLLIQLSTRGALLRAEAFLFRRSQVTCLEDGSHRFFYITNRRPGDSWQDWRTVSAIKEARRSDSDPTMPRSSPRWV